ncbi:Initiation-specific alpha-1,6-mannosyltransferase [Nakaseomyces bracarensis]|uniref:Initiation-specific alpha-1,6-mannosyltransferase n=1 Tax=Nakaseomyces bracarensis TaxID=273131 RepID=A0ABR4NZQ6_9SACH
MNWRKEIVQNLRRNLLLSVLVGIALLNMYFKLGAVSRQFIPSYKQKMIKSTQDIDDINLRDPTTFLSIDDFRAQLTRIFPYDPKSPIPRHIWQSWKVPHNHPNLDEDTRDFIQGWKNEAVFGNGPWTEESEERVAEVGQHYNHRYTLITDDQVLAYLNEFYGEVPVIIEAFKLIPHNIMKADFFRYLILYARGGIYSDIDTVPVKTFEAWPSLRHDIIEQIKENAKIIPYKGFQRSRARIDHYQEPGLVVGIEADPDREDWADWYARRIQFCQWTIQSKPGHPVLRELIMNITATTLYSTEGVPSDVKKMLNTSGHEEDFNINYRYKKRFAKSINHKEKKTARNVDNDDIMNWTGPGVFSDIIVEYMTHIIRKNKDVLLINDNLAVNRQINFSGENNDGVEDDFVYSTKKFYSIISSALESICRVSWEFFSLITEPVLVDDIMVLPITCFSPNVEQMNSKDITHPLALVLHFFAGSWKDHD